MFQSFALRADEIISAVPVQEGETSLPPGELCPQQHGVIGILLELLLEESEDPVIGAEEFLPVCLGHLRQVADHPADGLELPFICEPEEAILGCHIREERELPAAQGAVITLALRRTQAGEKDH